MKKILTSLVAAATLGTAVLAGVGTAEAQPRWRHHRSSGIDPAGAAALGIIGGLAIGSAIASQNSRAYYYEDEPVVVRRRPVRVYEDDYYVPVRRRPGPRCQTIIKYDMYGRPYEWKDCD